MTVNPYGLHGAPAVGGGLPGLPRRVAPQHSDSPAASFRSPIVVVTNHPSGGAAGVHVLDTDSTEWRVPSSATAFETLSGYAIISRDSRYLFATDSINRLKKISLEDFSVDAIAPDTAEARFQYAFALNRAGTIIVLASNTLPTVLQAFSTSDLQPVGPSFPMAIGLYDYASCTGAFAPDDENIAFVGYRKHRELSVENTVFSIINSLTGEIDAAKTGTVSRSGSLLVYPQQEKAVFSEDGSQIVFSYFGTTDDNRRFSYDPWAGLSTLPRAVSGNTGTSLYSYKPPVFVDGGWLSAGANGTVWFDKELDQNFIVSGPFINASGYPQHALTTTEWLLTYKAGSTQVNMTAQRHFSPNMRGRVQFNLPPINHSVGSSVNVFTYMADS